MKGRFHFALFIALTFGCAQAQDLEGDWQGTLNDGSQPRGRLVLRIAKADSGSWSGVLYRIDWDPGPKSVGAVMLEDRSVRFTVDRTNGSPSYEGILSQDGAFISGT